MCIVHSSAQCLRVPGHIAISYCPLTSPVANGDIPTARSIDTVLCTRHNWAERVVTARDERAMSPTARRRLAAAEPRHDKREPMTADNCRSRSGCLKWPGVTDRLLRTTLRTTTPLQRRRHRQRMPSCSLILSHTIAHDLLPELRSVQSVGLKLSVQVPLQDPTGACGADTLVEYVAAPLGCVKKVNRNLGSWSPAGAHGE